jgi:phosphate transport system protein
MSPRGTFDHQLNTLAHRVVRMGSLVEEAIELALNALLQRDTPLAHRVLRADDDVNAMRFQIEEESYTLLALQQPLARDLRVVSAAITAAVNLERIGDHAVAIAVLARKLNQETELKAPVHIARMGQVARSMLRQSLDAYISYDTALATDVANEDAQLNQLKEECVQQLLNTMSGNPTCIRQGTYLIWVSHRLERIGDCVKNICERTVYITTNELFDFDRHPTDEFDVELSEEDMKEEDTP